LYKKRYDQTQKVLLGNRSGEKSWKLSYAVYSTPPKQTRKKVRKTVLYTWKNTVYSAVYMKEYGILKTGKRPSK